jgi:hypothetical protein
MIASGGLSRGRKPRKHCPEYKPGAPLSLSVAKWTCKLAEGWREEAETRRTAGEAEAKHQCEEARPLHDVLQNGTAELADTAHLYSSATQQLRRYHIAILDECLMNLNPFPMGVEEKLERLRDTFWSLMAPEVHIDGYVIEFV